MLRPLHRPDRVMGVLLGDSSVGDHQTTVGNFRDEQHDNWEGSFLQTRTVADDILTDEERFDVSERGPRSYGEFERREGGDGEAWSCVGSKGKMLKETGGRMFGLTKGAISRPGGPIRSCQRFQGGHIGGTLLASLVVKWQRPAAPAQRP